jgi:hypothetical protein
VDRPRAPDEQANSQPPLRNLTTLDQHRSRFCSTSTSVPSLEEQTIAWDDAQRPADGSPRCSVVNATTSRRVSSRLFLCKAAAFGDLLSVREIAGMGTGWRHSRHLMFRAGT